VFSSELTIGRGGTISVMKATSQGGLVVTVDRPVLQKSLSLKKRKPLKIKKSQNGFYGQAVFTVISWASGFPIQKNETVSPGDKSDFVESSQELGNMKGYPRCP